MSLSNSYPALRPSMLLDFSNSETIDPRITFTRASTARYYDQSTVAKAEENLLLNSQAFSGTGWSTAGVALNVDSAAAPDGTTTAELMYPTISGTYRGIFTHAANSAVTPALISASAKAISFFAKASGFSWVYLFDATHADQRCYFDVTNGVTGTAAAGHTLSISSVGNGWYRCVATTTTAYAAGALLGIGVADADNSTTATASGTNGVLVWGAQLEQRSAVTAYTATTTAPITRYQPQLMTAAANVARLDHDPITREARGLLIEESRSNLVTFSEDYSNAAWTKDANRGTFNTTTVAPDGTLTARILIAGSGNAGYCYRTVSTTPGTAYTFSVYAKAGSVQFGYVEALGNAICYVNLLTLAVVPVAGLTVTATSVGNGWVRIAATGTASAASHAFAFGASSASGSQTMPAGTEAYFWGAQLEAGAFATSYIARLDATAASRAADAASMTGANFSSWYRADEGTLYCELGSIASTSITQAPGFSVGDVNNRVELRVVGNSFGHARGVAQANGSGQADISITTLASVAARKVALAYKVNDFYITGNGSATGDSDTLGIVPVASQALIGTAPYDANTKTNGAIKKIAYYPARLTNAQLAALTR